METPLFVQAIAGGPLINAFETQLQRYGVNVCFKQMVLRYEKVNGKNMVDAYFGIQKKHQLTVEFIVFCLLAVEDSIGEKRKRDDAEKIDC